VKSIQIEQDIYDQVMAMASAGEPPAQVLRRALHAPQPLVSLDIDDDLYAWLSTRAVSIGESASSIIRRELQEPRPGTGPRTVEFHIPAGTGAGPWNTQANPVVATVGDTLRIFNDDTVPHRPHTDNGPFPHPATDIPPGVSADFLLTKAFGGPGGASLYDHDFGAAARFWIVVHPDA
jgi:hypothetical protein